MSRTRSEFSRDLFNTTQTLRNLFNNRLSDKAQDWVVTIKPIEVDNTKTSNGFVASTLAATQIPVKILGEDFDYCKGYLFWKVNNEVVDVINKRWSGLTCVKNLTVLDVGSEYKEICYTTVWNNHGNLCAQAFGGMVITAKVVGLYNNDSGSLDSVNVLVAFKTRF